MINSLSIFVIVLINDNTCDGKRNGIEWERKSALAIFWHTYTEQLDNARGGARVCVHRGKLYKEKITDYACR